MLEGWVFAGGLGLGLGRQPVVLRVGWDWGLAGGCGFAGRLGLGLGREAETWVVLG
jgi:hypothetical protein